jgi:hypothetical protein
MSIRVVCPGCQKRYQVNDKCAGKTGPCPNCKFPITIPDKTGEVVIDTPEPFAHGGRNSNDQLVLKPISRTDAKFKPLWAGGIAGLAATVFAAALIGEKFDLFKDHPIITAAALLLISPVLAWAAYGFLYDDEFESYKGRPLLIRVAICGLIYSLLWGLFVYASGIILTGEVWPWVFIAPLFLSVGAMVASISLDLELGSGFFHYSFYILITILLRWAAGMGWIWNIN